MTMTSILVALQICIIFAKVLGVFTASWWIVFIPTFALALLTVLYFAVVFMIVLLLGNASRRR